MSVAQASRDLGIHANMLRKWVRDATLDPVQAFPVHGQMKPEQAEIGRLKKEVARLRIERDNLKKPRPISPRNRREVRVRGEAPSGLADGDAVRGARCVSQRVLCVVGSVRTIGRLIADAPDKMRHAPRRVSRFGQGRVLRRPRMRKPKGYRPGRPGDCVALDTIERRKDGLARYLVTCIDLASRFSFALAFRTRASAQAALTLHCAQIVLPVPVRRVLSDNGGEFAKDFHDAIARQGLVHWHTTPRTPKMNAHCERFNRTLQEEFVDYHEALLFDDLDAFNDRLFEWLHWYNAERPHHALALRTPLDILADQLGNECRMYWPNTGT